VKRSFGKRGENEKNSGVMGDRCTDPMEKNKTSQGEIGWKKRMLSRCSQWGGFVIPAPHAREKAA